jgi:hypothetical protein
MNTEPNTSFDSPWKDIVETYLPEFFAFFFPDAYTAIDWERGFDFLDQELRQGEHLTFVTPKSGFYVKLF